MNVRRIDVEMMITKSLSVKATHTTVRMNISRTSLLLVPISFNHLPKKNNPMATGMLYKAMPSTKDGFPRYVITIHSITNITSEITMEGRRIEANEPLAGILSSIPDPWLKALRKLSQQRLSEIGHTLL